MIRMTGTTGCYDTHYDRPPNLQWPLPQAILAPDWPPLTPIGVGLAVQPLTVPLPGQPGL